MSRPYVIGVTGNIACGKSAVMEALARRGVTIVDGDQVYRELTGPGSELVELLGGVFGLHVVNVDGSLNRSALGNIVFSDLNALHKLDQLTHPVIVSEVLRRVEAAKSPFVATDGIKLIESGLADRCDEVWVVTCPPEQQRDRLMARNGLTREEADRRIAAQSPVADKLARADVVITNGTTLDDLDRQVANAWMTSNAASAARRYLPSGYEM